MAVCLSLTMTERHLWNRQERQRDIFETDKKDRETSLKQKDRKTSLKQTSKCHALKTTQKLSKVFNNK